MKVKELLDSPEKWTKGHYSRDKLGNPAWPENDDATCFCLMGAIRRCYGFGPRGNEIVKRCCDRIKCDDSGSSLGPFNDAPERTFDEVRQLITELDI